MTIAAVKVVHHGSQSLYYAAKHSFLKSQKQTSKQRSECSPEVFHIIKLYPNFCILDWHLFTDLVKIFSKRTLSHFVNVHSLVGDTINIVLRASFIPVAMVNKQQGVCVWKANYHTSTWDFRTVLSIFCRQMDVVNIKNVKCWYFDWFSSYVVALTEMLILWSIFLF